MPWLPAEGKAEDGVEALANGPRTPWDEGLSYIDIDGTHVLLKEPIRGGRQCGFQ